MLPQLKKKIAIKILEKKKKKGRLSRLYKSLMPHKHWIDQRDVKKVESKTYDFLHVLWTSRMEPKDNALIFFYMNNLIDGTSFSKMGRLRGEV